MRWGENRRNLSFSFLLGEKYFLAALPLQKQLSWVIPSLFPDQEPKQTFTETPSLFNVEQVPQFKRANCIFTDHMPSQCARETAPRSSKSWKRQEKLIQLIPPYSKTLPSPVWGPGHGGAWGTVSQVPPNSFMTDTTKTVAFLAAWSGQHHFPIGKCRNTRVHWFQKIQSWYIQFSRDDDITQTMILWSLKENATLSSFQNKKNSFPLKKWVL